MTEKEEENISSFKENGYPLYCPYCKKTVNLFLIDYRRHLEANPSTCMYCKKTWKLENNNWI